MTNNGDIKILRSNKDALIKLVKAGASCLVISKFFGVTINSVTTFCSLNSIRNPFYLDGKPMKEKMVKMLRDGEPVSHIFNTTGISHAIIKRTAKEYGYKYISAFVPINERTKSNILRLLKNNYSSQQIVDKLKLKDISCKVILDLKKKYKVKGLTRGGVSKIPPEEIAYIKKLMRKDMTVPDIMREMNKKFDKMYGYELIRGRCRMYGYKRCTIKPYDENEKKIMMKAVSAGLNVIDTVPLFPDRTYSSIKKLREMTKAYYNREKFKEAV